MMASDTDWVEDVRRWYFNGGQTRATRTGVADRPAAANPTDLGYEAAHPALQTKNWTDQVHSGLNNLG